VILKDYNKLVNIKDFKIIQNLFPGAPPLAGLLIYDHPGILLFGSVASFYCDGSSFFLKKFFSPPPLLLALSSEGYLSKSYW